MHKYRFGKILCFIIFIIFLIISTAKAEAIKPPFDVNEVIKKVSPYEFPESREGEFLIDTNVIYSPSHGDESGLDLASAFDGTNYLAVWTDWRNGNIDIFGARVNQSGVVLDSSGIAIATTPGRQTNPAVAFDGINYLVIWLDRDHYSLCGTRINQAGVILDSTPIEIASDPVLYKPAIAFGSTCYLVVWTDWFYSADIYGARVSQSGVVLDQPGFVVSLDTSNQMFPAIAFDDTNFLVVWKDNRNGNYDIYGARVNEDGMVLDSSGIAISTAPDSQVNPRVTYGDSTFLVVWEDGRDIYGARVNKNGIVLDSNGIIISPIDQTSEFPSVAFDGINYLVIWCAYGVSVGNTIYGARMDQSGMILDTAGFSISTNAWDRAPELSFGITNYLALWVDYRSYVNIYGARVNLMGEVMDSTGIVISYTANNQSSPEVAFDGTNYMVAWTDYRHLQPDIYGERVSPAGVLLDSLGIVICSDGHSQNNPAIAFDGTNYLIVWEDNRNYPYDLDIYGSRITQSGIVLDSIGIPIAIGPSGQGDPAIAFDNTNYLIVWGNGDIYGTRVNQLGQVLDSNYIAISTVAESQSTPAVSYGDSNYLVVWTTDIEPGHWGVYEIHAARINLSGILIDTSEINISNHPDDNWFPDVAFDGTNYLVTWMQYAHIIGKRVSLSGNVIDSAGIFISNASWYPAIAFDGSDYFVVWEDHRNGYTNRDIYGAKVNSSGIVIDSFAVSLQPRHQCTPALAHGIDEQIFVTYSGWTDKINNHNAYALRIWGKIFPFTGIEEDKEFNAYMTNNILQIYPNPCKGKVSIKFQLPSNSLCAQNKFDLKIYDVTGRLVKQFNQQTIQPSNHQFKVVWDGTNELGYIVPDGIYLVNIKLGNLSRTEKVIFLK